MSDIPGSIRTTTIVIFFAYMAICIGIGLYARWKAQKAASTGGFLSDFYTGGRSMGPLVAGLMLGASMCGAGTFVSGPGLGFQTGLIWIIAVLASGMLNFFVLGQVGKKLGIVARRMDGISFAQILKSRYNNNPVISILIPLTIVLFFISYVSSQLIGGARLLEPMTGLSYPFCLLLFIGVVLIYTLLGGMKGVQLSTAFQGFVMSAAAIALFVGVMSKIRAAGGLELNLRLIAETDPNFVSPFAWSVGTQFYYFVMFGIAYVGCPHVVQSAFNSKDTKSMHGAILVGIVVVCLWQGIMTFMGPAARILNPGLAVPDHATQYLAMTTLPAWGAGVIMAGAAGAIQSTIASMAVIISSAIVKDLYFSYIKKQQAPAAVDSKRITFIITIAIMAIVGILSVVPPDFLQYLVNFAVGGLISTLYVPLIFGSYWKRANEYGAVAAVLGGMAYYLAANLLWPQIGLGMGTVVMPIVCSIILMVVISLLTPKSPKGDIMLWFGKDYSLREEETSQ